MNKQKALWPFLSFIFLVTTPALEAFFILNNSGDILEGYLSDGTHDIYGSHFILPSDSEPRNIDPTSLSRLNPTTRRHDLPVTTIAGIRIAVMDNQGNVGTSSMHLFTPPYRITDLRDDVMLVIQPDKSVIRISNVETKAAATAPSSSSSSPSASSCSRAPSKKPVAAPSSSSSSSSWMPSAPGGPGGSK